MEVCGRVPFPHVFIRTQADTPAQKIAMMSSVMRRRPDIIQRHPLARDPSSVTGLID